MIAICFVDTNVLVYARDAQDREKQQRAHEWLTHLWEAGAGRVSTQVLSEYFVTVTQKLEPGLARERAWQDVVDLMAWMPGPIDVRVLEAAWQIHHQASLSWWDALIVASAETQGCDYVITEDMQHDRELGSLRIISPFRVSPAEISA
jgi:predicted nucleic acid-binding protein